jgi:hypothetical protein
MATTANCTGTNISSFKLLQQFSKQGKTKPPVQWQGEVESIQERLEIDSRFQKEAEEQKQHLN